MARHLSVQYNDEHMPLIHTVVSLNEIHSLQCKEDTATDTLFHFDLENNGIHLKLFITAICTMSAISIKLYPIWISRCL
ncbi:hypothetical protein QNN00_16705 [Bacillus velezensis]|nr:hypothetical protein [Bacillus velezensis]